MKQLPEALAHMLDRMAPLGTIVARRMFSGWGIYCDGAIFAIVAKDVIYLKADDAMRADFEALGIPAFKPFADKPMLMPYHALPDAAHDDDDVLLAWAARSVAVGRRAAAGRPDAHGQPKARSPRTVAAGRTR